MSLYISNHPVHLSSVSWWSSEVDPLRKKVAEIAATADLEQLHPLSMQEFLAALHLLADSERIEDAHPNAWENCTVDGLRWPKACRMLAMLCSAAERSCDFNREEASLAVAKCLAEWMRNGFNPNALLPLQPLYPLHHAAIAGSALLCRALLELNVQVDCERSASNETPLKLAAMQGHHLAMQVLLQAGANVEGGKASHAVVGASALIVSLHYPKAVHLLLANGANPIALNPGQLLGHTALEQAVRFGLSQTVAIVLKYAPIASDESYLTLCRIALSEIVQRAQVVNWQLCNKSTWTQLTNKLVDYGHTIDILTASRYNRSIEREQLPEIAEEVFLSFEKAVVLQSTLSQLQETSVSCLEASAERMPAVVNLLFACLKILHTAVSR